MALKALFLIFHGFEESNGISKKIRYQIKALKQCGVDVRTCWLDDKDGHKYRMIDDQILEDYGPGFMGKIRKRTNFQTIVDYVRKQQIQFIYIRYAHNANPFTIRFIKQLKKCQSQIVMEIPTYPYDQEYKGMPLPYQRILFIDKCFRTTLAKSIDKIVTFSNHTKIFNRPTIQISNGIDFDELPVKSKKNDTSKELHLIGVATIHPWHGFDRVIKGLALYYKNKSKFPYLLYFHIVGFGVPETVDYYKQLVKEHHLEQYVIFHSGLYGKDLDDIFDSSDLGIGSLARHRSGIYNIKTLKNREYAARGIPFIYSENDEDFDHQPYILKIAADETPIDIERLILFYQEVKQTPLEIRQSIEQTLSWKVQMQRVINETI